MVHHFGPRPTSFFVGGREFFSEWEFRGVYFIEELTGGLG